MSLSGHSRWSQIKHKKSKEDARRGRLFSKLSRAIYVAARQGGGSPETNLALAQAIEKAREYDMPLDNIERLIKRGTGELAEGETFEQLIYEGYAPGGVAVMVDVMTDNKNRTAAEIRNLFSRYQGHLGESGCVNWLFERKGMITIVQDEGIEEDDVLSIVLEAGAEDFKVEDDSFVILTAPEDFKKVKDDLKEKGYELASAEVTMVPKSQVKVEASDAKKVIKLIEALEDHEDVQEVYSNFDIPTEIIEELAAAN